MREMYRDCLIQGLKDNVYNRYEKLPSEAKKLTISEALKKQGGLNEYTNFFAQLNYLVLGGVVDFEVNSSLEEVVNNLKGINQKGLPPIEKAEHRKRESER